MELKMKRKIYGSMAICLTLAFLALPGAMLLAEEGVNELDTIVVTADRMPEPLRRVSQNVTVFTEEDIKNSGADGIIDLLKKVGVQTYADGAAGYGNEGIIMRGSKSSMHGFDLAGDILVLVDGHRTGADTFSNIELDNTERVEVIRGPGAVQYGAAAMGGVVNIITKKGREKTEGMVETGIGSHGENRAKTAVSGQNGRMDFSAAGSYYTQDPYETGKGDIFQNSDLDYRTRYSLNLGWNFDEMNRLGLIVSGSDTEDAGKGPDTGSSYKDTRQDRGNHFYDLSYEGKTRGLGWMVRYFQGEVNYYLSRFYTAASRNRREPFSESENAFKGGQGQFNWNFDRFQLLSGLDWMSYDFYQEQIGSNKNTADSTFDNIGAFLLAKAHLMKDRNLTLSTGVRFDEFDVSVDSTRSSTAGVLQQRYGADQTRDTWLPSVGIAYAPVDLLKFRASWAQAFKMPLPRQLGGFTYMAMTPFVGNPDLQPEESETWDVGLDLDYQALFLSLGYFSTRYENMITYETVTGKPGFPATIYWYYNEDRASIDGLELGATFDLGEQWGLALKLEPYVYWTRLLKYEDSDGWNLTDRSRDTLSWGLQFGGRDEGLTVNVNATYYGAILKSSTSSGITVSQSEIPYTSATVWDLSLMKRLYNFKDYGDVQLKLSVKNAFDTFYAGSEDSYMPGRTFYGGLVYRF